MENTALSSKYQSSIPRAVSKAAGLFIDQNGNLWTEEEIISGKLPQNYWIVGKVVS